MKKFSEISYTEHLESWIRENYNRFTVSVVYITIIFLLAYALPSLLRMDIFPNDMQQFVSWSYSYQDPALFNARDLIKDYFSANSPIGYKLFYRAFATLIDPQVLGELLSLVLIGCAAFLSYLVGRQITNEKHWGGLASLALFVFSIFHNNVHVRALDFISFMTGGLPRSFALPLILLSILSLLRRNFWLLGIAILLAALFYPPAFIILIMYSVLTFGWHFLKERVIHKYWLKTIFASALAASIILIWRQTSGSNDFGAPFSLNQAQQMAEFHEGGILPLLDWKMYVLETFQLLNIPAFVWFSIVVITAILTAKNKDSAPKFFRSEIGLLCLSALVNYALAYILFIKLYEPNRYVIFVWQCLSLCIFPFTCELILKFVQVRFAKASKPGLFSKVKLHWIVIILTIFVLTYSSLRFVLNRGGNLHALPTETYQFLKTLPKGALIAAHPRDASDITMRSQRSVLLMETALFPYNVKFYEEMKDRLTAIWATMYATDIQPILELKQKYKVDYFILNKNLYKHDPLPHQPYLKQLKLFEAELGDREPLISILAKKDAIAFHKDEFYVLNLEELIDNSLQNNKARL